MANLLQINREQVLHTETNTSIPSYRAGGEPFDLYILSKCMVMVIGMIKSQGDARELV